MVAQDKTIQTLYCHLIQWIVNKWGSDFSSILRFILLFGMTCIVASCHSNGQQAHLMLSSSNQQKAAQVRLALGVAYLEQGDLKRALSNLQRAADYTPDDYQVHLALALYEQQVGEHEKANQRYQLALSLQPQASSVLNHYGKFLCEQKEYTFAQKQFDLALNHASYDMIAPSLENKGYCYLKEGQYQQTKEFLGRALQYEPARSTNILVTIKDYLEQRQGEEVATLFSIYQQYAARTAESLWLQIRFAKLNNEPKKITDYGRQLAEDFSQSVQYKRFLANEY